MTLPNNNHGWTHSDTSVDHMTNGEDYSELVVTYRHKNGHSLQHVIGFRLMGDVMVNGERPDYALDGFVTSSDDDYERAVSEAGDDDKVTRSFWIYAESEVWDAIDANDELIEPQGERSEVDCGWINLEYTGRYDADGTELNDEIESAMRKWAEGYGVGTLYANDLDRIYSDLASE